jgi:hypothetical protein
VIPFYRDAVVGGVADEGVGAGVKGLGILSGEKRGSLSSRVARS